MQMCRNNWAPAQKCKQRNRQSVSHRLLHCHCHFHCHLIFNPVVVVQCITSTLSQLFVDGPCMRRVDGIFDILISIVTVVHPIITIKVYHHELPDFARAPYHGASHSAIFSVSVSSVAFTALFQRHIIVVFVIIIAFIFIIFTRLLRVILHISHHLAAQSA